MMKALIIGADGVRPDYIFEHKERYPNLAQLIDSGASASYSAYVQKGYKDSYLSEMNWSSIYTGLAPQEHNIAVKDADGHRRGTCMEQYDSLQPFWKVLNENGISVGLWGAMCCENPVEIDGYAVSVQHVPLETPDPVRTVKKTLQCCEKDKDILNVIKCNIPLRQYPLTLEQQGYSFEELKKDPELAWEAIEKYHFREVLGNFRQELDFFSNSMCAAQKERPVDVMYFYTPTTDLAAHCCMYCDDNDVLIGAYKLLDEFVGKLMNEFQPENVIFLSDHGMVNFKELINCSDEKTRREAFAARDEVLWLKNGYIAFEAHNGALLFTAHGLKGMFIAAGKNIRHIKLTEMRTLDIYPTMLEMLGVKIPEGRSGYAQDIFERQTVNPDKTLPKDIKYSEAAVLQCFSPSLTDILLNELYLHNRFTKFTVVGEEKYREIFLNNPRVSEFISYEDFDVDIYDDVYCGVYTETAGLSGHIKICGGK